MDDTLGVSRDELDSVLSELVGRLTDNLPYFHPAYAGQMLKPPHPVAMLAYALAQTINPNNHANDGGPATSKMEFEVVDELAGMFGFDRYVGHLTGGGTVANLEALWVARQLIREGRCLFEPGALYPWPDGGGAGCVRGADSGRFRRADGSQCARSPVGDG